MWLQPRGWGGDQGRREASGRVPAPFAGRDSTPSRGYGDSKGCIEPISVLGGALPQGGVRWRSFGTPCLLSGPRPGPGRPLPDPGAPAQAGRAGGWVEAAGAGGVWGAGRRGRGLPLVGGGLPGPGQPRAAHRLVPERAVLVDAAHSPQAAARGGGGTARAQPGGRGETRDSRRLIREGRSRAGLKGAEPHSCPPGPRAVGGGFREDPRLGPSHVASCLCLFLATRGRPCPNTRTKGKSRPGDPIGSALRQ